MSRIEIEQCTDIDKLKALCLEQRKQLNYIGEVLVDVSKWHITPELAIEQIRDYLVKNQYNLRI